MFQPFWLLLDDPENSHGTWTRALYGLTTSLTIALWRERAFRSRSVRYAIRAPCRDLNLEISCQSSVGRSWTSKP